MDKGNEATVFYIKNLFWHGVGGREKRYWRTSACLARVRQGRILGQKNQERCYNEV
jgi:hypothetical protein